MSLGKSKVVKEIEGWRPFGEALRGEDRELYGQMMQRVCEYLPSMEVSADPFPSDSLLMGLIFLQHRMIEQLTEKLEKAEEGR
ncbi:MAG: hypothetical protein ABSF83_05415 [Nitrososphaerales archaeon]|jgi:hypothetical protein